MLRLCCISWLSISMLGACGYRGDLYLPTSTPVGVTTPIEPKPTQSIVPKQPAEKEQLILPEWNL